MHITLRPNERIFINGAVLKVDRKVSLELLNDAVFLLEAHVMLEQKATTPLRRLYFIVQLMLMEPTEVEPKKVMFNLHGLSIAANCKDPSILTGLAAVSDLVDKGRPFEALKLIRTMLPLEDQMLIAAEGNLGTLAVVDGAVAAPKPVVAPSPVRPAPRTGRQAVA